MRPDCLHFKHANFMRRTEAVLDRPQNAVDVVPLALEVEHGIHHVLHDPRAGDDALLGDVSDDQNRQVMRLGELRQPGGAVAYLVDAARRRGRFVREHGLDGVDDEDPRPQRFGLSADMRHGGFGENVDVPVLQAEPLGVHAELAGRFFPRDVEGRGTVALVRPAQAMGGLQEEG